MKTTMTWCAGAFGAAAMMLTGCGSTSGGSKEILMRDSLSVTQDEVARIEARDARRQEDLDAIARANARVQAHEEARNAEMMKKMEQVRSYQEERAAKMRAEEEAEVAARRAKIARIQESLEPELQAIRDEESRLQEEVEDVRRRRGIQ